MVKEIGDVQPAAMYEHDAARYLKLSVNDVRAFVRTGAIVARRHPNRSRRIYLRSDLDRYLESLKREEVPA
jgi:hypothetical protein